MEKETKIAKAWEYKGRKCVIIWHGHHYCAYAETKLKGVDYSQEFGNYETSPSYNISAHGGITFSGELIITPFEKDIWFFGIDFAHSGDYVDYVSFTNQGKKWTLEEVEHETEKLVDGIINYEKLYYKYKEAFDKFEQSLKEINSAEKEQNHSLKKTGEKNE